MYQHKTLDGKKIDLPVGKVVCVGWNYDKHISEMKQLLSQSSARPSEPVLFMKPATSLCSINQPLTIPTGFGSVHHELEMAILLNSELKNATQQQAMFAIWGYAIALDLTLRDLQTELKNKGQPWEKAKGFDNACPISGFIAQSEFTNPQQTALQLRVNQQLRHDGNTEQMIFSIAELLVYMSKFFTLQAGDVILTGTPDGVGALQTGDQLTINFQKYCIKTSVEANY